MFRSILEIQAEQERKEKERSEKSRNCAKMSVLIKEKLTIKQPVPLIVSDEFINALGMNEAARKVLARDVYYKVRRINVINEASQEFINRLIMSNVDKEQLIKPWFAAIKKLLSQEAHDPYLVVLEGLNQLREMIQINQVRYEETGVDEIDADKLRSIEKYLKRLQGYSNDSDDSSGESAEIENGKPSIITIVNKEIANTPAMVAFNITREFVKFTYSSKHGSEFAITLTNAMHDLGLEIEDSREEARLTM